MNRLLGFVLGSAVLLITMPVRADFFDDARKALQSDIPHFFQDDIPCAFGGKPTSHTRTGCKAPDHAAKPTAKPEVIPPRDHAAPARVDRKVADP